MVKRSYARVLVTWDTARSQLGSVIEIGRMIGRIVYAPAIGDSPAIKGWIMTATLGMEHTAVFERWINPAWVTQVHPNVPDIARFLSFFAGDELPDRDTLRGWIEYGGFRPNQDPDRPEWDMSLDRYREVAQRNGRTIGRLTRGGAHVSQR
jgi:hypothetical protein